MVYYNQHTVKAIVLREVCQVVKINCVPRSGCVEQAMGKESQLSVVESVLVDIRRGVHNFFLHLGEVISTRICRVL
jgi:hypothetical protein